MTMLYDYGKGKRCDVVIEARQLAQLVEEVLPDGGSIVHVTQRMVDGARCLVVTLQWGDGSSVSGLPGTTRAQQGIKSTPSATGVGGA